MDEYTPSDKEMAGWVLVGALRVSGNPDGDLLWDAWLAAHDARVARLEAQADIRGRAVVIYRERAREAEAERDEWRQTALDECAAALDALEQIKARDARIKAVRELHQRSAMVRRIPRFMREGHDDYQPFHYCTGCDGARYPCDTIRALDGDA